MKTLMKNLAELQALELGQGKKKEKTPQITELRAEMPAQILGHYDRLMARGKKGVVPVRNHCCSGCHMRLPLAVVMTLRHGDDIQLCAHCDRYLFLPDEPQESPEESEGHALGEDPAGRAETGSVLGRASGSGQP